MDQHDLILRLTGTDVPSGQIDLESLAAIASSLQELATRVGRLVIGQEGPGRTAGVAARVVRLRLAGLSEGSTLLTIPFGEGDVLPMDAGIGTEIAEKFWEILTGIEHAERPGWTTPLVSQAAVHVLDALARAASQVSISRADGRSASWQRDSVSRDPWLGPGPVVGETSITVSGRLEMVDLRRAQFRLRDDVGNAITLVDVANPEEAGPLVGERAVAMGLPVCDSTGRLQSMEAATVSAAPIPPEWTVPRRTDLEALVAAVPGPDPAGIAGVTDHDVTALLSLLRA